MWALHQGQIGGPLENRQEGRRVSEVHVDHMFMGKGEGRNDALAWTQITV